MANRKKVRDLKVGAEIVDRSALEHLYKVTQAANGDVDNMRFKTICGCFLPEEEMTLARVAEIEHFQPKVLADLEVNFFV